MSSSQLQELHRALDELNRFIATQSEDPFVVDLGVDVDVGADSSNFGLPFRSGSVLAIFMGLVTDVTRCYANVVRPELMLPPMSPSEEFINYIQEIEYGCEQKREGSPQQIAESTAFMYSFRLIRNYSEIIMDEEHTPVPTPTPTAVIDGTNLLTAMVRSNAVMMNRPEWPVKKAMIEHLSNFFTNRDPAENESKALHLYDLNRTESASEVSLIRADTFFNDQIIAHTFQTIDREKPIVDLKAVGKVFHLIEETAKKEEEVPNTVASSNIGQSLSVVIGSLISGFLKLRMKRLRKIHITEQLFVPTEGKSKMVQKMIASMSYEEALALGGAPEHEILTTKLYQALVVDGKALLHPTVVRNVLKLMNFDEDGFVFIGTDLVLQFLRHYKLKILLPRHIRRALNQYKIM